MKRYIAVLLSLVLVASFALVGCQGNTDGQTAANQEQGAQVEMNEETQAVIDAIDAIGEVTLDSGEAIQEVRAAYDELDDDHKELISNYDKLQADEKELSRLEDERDKAEAEAKKVLAIGDTVEDADFRVTLTGASITPTLQSPQSRTTWETDDAYTFVVLEFDVEALNSNAIPIGRGAISDLVANYNGNTYKGFEYRYLTNELWIPAQNTYFEANMPVHVYVYATIPATATNGSVTVDMEIAGEEKTLTI